MKRELAPLEAQETPFGTRYVFGDKKVAFPYERWVPTLADIDRAQTFGEQRERLAEAIIGVAGSYKGLVPASDARLDYWASGITARFKGMNEGDGNLRLTYLAIGSVGRIGYQTPDEDCPNPAFAVVDAQRDEYHRVARDPTEKLEAVEQNLGLRALSVLATELDNRFPGFDLQKKLTPELRSSPFL